MKKPLAQRREAYRLWFEYLRLARMSTNADAQAALEKIQSKVFYAPWQMEKGLKFDEWWRTHGQLFEERFEVRELKPGELPQDPDALIVEVPLTLSATELTKRIRLFLQAAIEKRRKSTKKSKKDSSAAYRLTEGAEPKLNAVREMLTVYRDVYVKNPTLRGKRLLAEVHKLYLGRKNKRFAKIPTTLLIARGEDANRVLRNMRRYITNAERVLLNVAGGKFPGDY